MKEIILASASKYRHELLSRLGLPFTAQSPAMDEEKERDPSLAPQALAEKLAFLKAQSLAREDRLVIGGDQLVSMNGEILGKPHTVEGACAQLTKMQGQRHDLITAVCVFDGKVAHPFANITHLQMKSLNAEQIKTYVQADLPLDCAGSYKIEKRGISLFESIESEDFSAIQGLPLLQLSKVLHNLGYRIP
jgi:septum formation protein